MPSVSVVAAAKPIGSAVVVVGAYSGRAGDPGAFLAPGAEAVDSALSGRLLSAYRSAGGSGQAEEIVKIPTLGLADFPLIVVAGLGIADSSGPRSPAEQIGRAVATAIRALPPQARVRICIGADQDPAELVATAALGAILGGYRFTGYKSAAPRPGRGAVEIGLGTPDSSARSALRRANVLGWAVTATRDLVNTPPNDLYPESFAQHLQELAEGLPVEVEILEERALRRQGFGGLLAVGRGSVRSPRLVRLTYRPARATSRVALVGEGTTYNSGGLNLKTTPMSWAKADMAGAAAVATALLAAARRRLPIEIVATLPMAENLPSGTAYRPSDVVTIWGGRTVEVTDTEASGRLTVAEAIGRAMSDEPQYLIEASTLTAAQRIALGPRIIAAMGEPAFRDRVIAAGATGGEVVWAMPLPAELRAGLDSSVADLATTAPDRWGAMLSGGAFLADFVPTGLPWVHLDITGPAWNTGSAHGRTPKGGTGAGVLTIISALESIASA